MPEIPRKLWQLLINEPDVILEKESFQKQIKELSGEVIFQTKLANLNKESFDSASSKLYEALNREKKLVEQIDAPFSFPPGELDEVALKWETRIPASEIRYQCRALHTGNRVIKQYVDVRVFWQPFNSKLWAIANAVKNNSRDKSFDGLALACLNYVRSYVAYRSDKVVQGIDEFWQYPEETLELRSGDCEDGAILLSNLMFHAGIPFWRIRLNAGPVKGGGHAYVTYCRQTDNQFVTLDWCYWPNSLPVSERKLWKNEEDYYGIDWSWNLKSCFKKETF